MPIRRPLIIRPINLLSVHQALLIKDTKRFISTSVRWHIHCSVFQKSQLSQKAVYVLNMLHTNFIFESELALNSNRISFSFHYEIEQVIFCYLFKFKDGSYLNQQTKTAFSRILDYSLATILKVLKWFQSGTLQFSLRKGTFSSFVN